ncbi:MAG: replication-associated recombination protein A [Actinobacteria bacterium]|nr:replication-associated recombination protein A [Actinomycetota bacterium]
MRPKTIEDVVGHAKLLAKGSPIRRLLEAQQGGAWSSIILWGPPGSGKTTIARLLVDSKAADFVELSAVSAGVTQVRDVIESAKKQREIYDRPTILFLDEIHRFSKSQQDSLLGAVESGILTLVAATTENPSFSIIRPLISRSLVFHLEPLTKKDVIGLLERAIEDSQGLNGAEADTAALDYIAEISSGDARRALTLLEATYSSGTITLENAKAASANQIAYDSKGELHYDTISAFIKSVRGSDPDAAIYYLARMIQGGEDPRFIARRLMILASEDIGLADPGALSMAVAAAQTVDLIGMPEGRIPLAEATIYLALAPKSNRAYRAINQAIADLENQALKPIPAHLRSTGAVGYQYPHDDPRGVLSQQYADLDKRYYEPSSHGYERTLAERLRQLDEILGK